MSKTDTIHFGFEIGTGTPVSVPLSHLAITGQTQNAGKTTALEALITRSGKRALAFVTKKHEGAFAGAVQSVQPYFREEADWRYVQAILEATFHEKLKFERNWIMRASKGARTLADVRRNVRSLGTKAKGLSGDMYYMLGEYLDIVIPQIERTKFAPALILDPGLNVMYLDEMSEELQALVIRSCLDWIYENATDTITVIPEAWQFIPQARGGPVKQAAEQLVRKGAGGRNYVWIDSQDIAGVDKLVLRACAVWALGVQREQNEVKRVLQHIPGNIAKPKPAEIMELSLGEFFVCHGKTVVRAYAQPAWLGENDAQWVARGQVTAAEIANAARPHLQRQSKPKSTTQPKVEADVKESEAAALREENARLTDDVSRLNDVIDDLRKEISKVRTESLGPRERAELEATTKPRAVASIGNGAGDLDSIYSYVRDRLMKEPKLLMVAVTKPEIDVAVKVETVSVDGSTALGMTARLISEGFFDGAATSTTAWKEAQRRGFGGVAARIYEACEKLTVMGFLTSEGKGVGYKAVPGMKVNIKRA